MQATAAPQRGDRLPFLASILSAVALAGVFGVGSVLWTLWYFGQDTVRAWTEMGFWGPLVALATGLAVVTSMGALVLRTLKPRLPAAVFLALGLLPWLVGTLGTSWGVRMCAQAISNVNPVDKATIMVNGIEEALASYLFGGGLSAVLLLGIALGLGVAALIVSSGRRGRAVEGPAFEVGPVASTVLLCLAAALAVVSCLQFASSYRSIFTAMTHVNPAQRMTVLAHAAEQLGPARGMARLVLGMALALGSGTALWVWRRAGMGAGQALAAGLCVVPAFAMHGLAFQNLKQAARTVVERPWASAGDFRPVSLPSPSDSAMEANALVTRTHLVPKRGARGGAPGAEVPLEGALAPALRELMDPDRLHFALGEDELREPELEPSLALAVDGRLEGAKLRGLLEAARTAGAHSLTFVGQSPPSPVQALFESEPILAPFLEELRTTVPVALLSALPRDYPANNMEGWQGRLRGGATVLTLTPRPDSGGEPVTVNLAQPPPEGELTRRSRREVPVYLVVGEDVTAEQVVRAAEALSRQSIAEQSLQPVLVMAPLPAFAVPTANDGPR